ncbi:glycine-rich protein [uncultured Ruminococcus sp.]|uniref:glycine-rich protein n=1 Tax=uncultured Ruminococcus sp. TaxID=165186 RepID=UPI0025F12752|nr:glycine-rich protein [uncultured Ruminococcus sp.]
MRNRIYSFVSAAIIALNSIPFVNFTAANAAKSASNSDSVFFPAVADGSNESAKLYHDDSLVDNGDGTFTFTSKITSAYSYSDYSESRLKSKDGEYKLDKEGKYLIEVWGGDGGDGSRSLLTGRNGVGGKGGFVYGILDVSEENELLGKKLVYEIGSKGESSTFQLDGGGTGGVGGGAGTITFISIGAGGGYSAVYLIDSDPDPEKDEKLDPADLKPNLRDDPEKVLMIAGGGGGGAAGGNGIHFYELFLKAKGDGGDGGSNKSAIQATPAIGVFNTGKYYSGADGTSAGGNTRYVGHGGTDKPGEATRDALNIIKGDNPNDWQRLYIEDGDRGAGSAGNLRGAGGGAGFAGGSGGLQNAMIDANNVGGGGGGSSYTAVMANFTPHATLTSAQEPFFVKQEDNIYADVGGAVVIRYLPENADYDYLNDVKISGTVSSYFDIVSATCTDKGGGAITVNQSGTGNRKIDFTGSIAPVSSGITKGQADDSMTLKLVLRPKTNFMGGNKVPIFADDGEFTCKTMVDRFYENNDINSTTDKQRSFAYAENVRFVNIPFKYKAGAKSKTISKDTPYDESDIIDSTVTNTLDANFANSVSSQYVAEVDETNKITDFTVADYNTKGLHKFDVVVEVVPKYDGADYVGTANPNPTYIRAHSVIEIIEGEKLDGFTVKASKSLDYTSSTDTYDFTVDFDVESQSSLNKSFSINQAIPSVKVLDLSLNNSNSMNTPDINSSYVTEISKGSNTYQATLAPGIYYVEAWGGDGGSGSPTPSGSTTTRTKQQGGYGGKGGYISGYVVVNANTTKSIDITLGTKGNDSSNRSGGKGGKATYVWIDQSSLEPANADLIAGGGGGGTGYMRYATLADQNDHMGYSGNDGYRINGKSSYRGVPADNSGYGTPKTSGYFNDNVYDGENGKDISSSNHRLSEYDNDNIGNNFAKGGFSKIGDGVSSGLTTDISNRLFIKKSGDNDISLSDLTDDTTSVNLGLYEYVYNYNQLRGFYVSQWSEGGTDDDDDSFQRISYYTGTTKTSAELKSQKAGAVRITRLGVYGGHDYDNIATTTLTDTTDTLDDVVDQIKNDYTDEYDRRFTVTSNFSQYFDLVTNNGTLDAETGRYTGTYQYSLTNADVYKVSNDSSTDNTTFAGYSVVTDNYSYGLKGSGSVTFKLQPKSNLVGGNDIPLLAVKTLAEINDYTGGNDAYMAETENTEVNIYHTGTTSETTDDDRLYLKRNDATDWANVAIDESVLTVTAPENPIIIDCGDTNEPDLSSAVTFAGKNDNSNIYTFVDTESDTAPSGAVTEDCKRTVIGTIKPKAEATKAVKIPSVEAVSKPAEADIKVRYSVTKELTNGVEQQGSVQYISGEAGPTDITADENEAILAATEDKLTLSKIQDAYVLRLEADSDHELPDATDVKVYYGSDPEDKAEADVTKSGGVITVTIPRSSFTNNITINAAGAAKKEYHVHYYYEYYDPETPNMIQTAHFEDPTVYYVSDNVTNLTDGLTPTDYPPWGGYANYYWEWPDEVTSSGTHTIVDGDIYVIGKFVKKNIPLTITYQYENGSPAAPTYSAPMEGYKTTVYNEAEDRYYFYLAAGDAYSVRSPDVAGYVPDKAVVAGIAPENGPIEVTVTYSSNTDPDGTEVIVNYVKCDGDGIPILQSDTQRETYTGVKDGEGNFDLERSGNNVVNNKVTELFSNGQIIRRTKLDNNKEIDVDSVSGKLEEGEKAEFYVYCRERPTMVKVNFNKIAPGESQPDPSNITIGMTSRKVSPGKEYGYDPEQNKYVGLPRAECSVSGEGENDWIESGWRFVGWCDSAGNPVDETTIVPSGDGPIDLYAHWQPLKVTITIEYKYALNISDTEKQGKKVAEIGTEGTKTITKAYGMVYKVTSPPLDNYTPDPDAVKGEALTSRTETVYYKDEGENSVKKITINVYSKSFEDAEGNPKNNAPKLTGGEFALYNQSNERVGALKLNEEGTLTWSNVEANIQDGVTYTVRCETPPTGYGCKEETVIISSGSDEAVKNIFLDRSPFQLPMAGGKPLTGYTVCGISTMLLAALLLFLYVSSKSEENEDE